MVVKGALTTTATRSDALVCSAKSTLTSSSLRVACGAMLAASSRSVMVNEMAQAAIVFAAFKKRDAPAVGLCQLRGSDHSLPPVAQLSRLTS